MILLFIHCMCGLLYGATGCRLKPDRQELLGSTADALKPQNCGTSFLLDVVQ
ncbi:hypothetical protein PAHAL_5G213000 [Panicum hallii]|uniref:Uncharacterized protein n=1 Tax=Panicum hallii TaxID=206008 RepID=A0A2T8IKS3_9POAL|nr:hypothetical protein PAHAL_5G213000 [Panicum hallii]